MCDTQANVLTYIMIHTKTLLRLGYGNLPTKFQRTFNVQTLKKLVLFHFDTNVIHLLFDDKEILFGLRQEKSL